MESKYSAFIMNSDQLDAVKKYELKKVYIPYDLFYCDKVSVRDIEYFHCNKTTLVYLVMPRILRKRDEIYLNKLKEFLLLGKADGVLIRDLEGVGFIGSLETDLEEQFISLNGKKQGFTPLMIDTDYSLYCWNKSSLDFYKSRSDTQTYPLELTIHELKELDYRDGMTVIYGRLPLMVSANCIKKTSGNCTGDSAQFSLKWKLIDRKNKDALVLTNCVHCYNEIFNSVPTSLHKYMYELIKSGFHEFRLDFTDEDSFKTEEILEYYLKDMRSGRFPVDEYTAAHFSKGAI